MQLSSVCERITSGGTPSRKISEYFTGDIPWVKTQELLDRWIDDTDEHITPSAVANSSSKLLPANTVLMAMYGATVGQLGLLRRPMTCNQAAVALVVDPSLADFRYVYYQLLHSRQTLRSLANGAAQQNLSGRTVADFEVPVPPLVEQKAIAGVLGALDDKIESNRRRSLIATELYQTEIRDMLLKLPDNGLGSLQQLSTFMSRSSERIGDVYAPEFSATVTGLEPRSSRFKKSLSAGNQKNKKIQAGDLVFGFSRRTLSFGVMRDPIGSVSPVYEVFSVHGGLEIAGLIEMQIRDQMHDFMDILKPGAREGQPIEAKYLLNKKLVLPYNPDGFIISEQIKNLARVVELSVSENRKLTMLRDTLLPELLSGRLRVKGAQSMVENV
jgi:type I restriction enzyme S subunit